MIFKKYNNNEGEIIKKLTYLIRLCVAIIFSLRDQRPSFRVKEYSCEIIVLENIFEGDYYLKPGTSGVTLE